MQLCGKHWCASAAHGIDTLGKGPRQQEAHEQSTDAVTVGCAAAYQVDVTVVFRFQDVQYPAEQTTTGAEFAIVPAGKN